MEHGDKAALIPLRELPRAVEEAVRLAGERHGLGHGGGQTLLRWDIIGRVVRELEEAERLSQGVSEHLNQAGHAVVPATIIINREILAGFIERTALPQYRQF